MFTLRCTQKLAKKLRLPAPPPAPAAIDPPPPTTALGDWYATILHTRPRHLVLCVSDASRLAVVLPSSPLGTLVPRFRRALRPLLQEIGISEAAIAREEAQMESLVFGPTRSRSVLGTMNDFVYQIEYDCDLYTPEEISLRLSEVPCGPLQMRYPREVAKELLESAAVPESQAAIAPEEERN